MIIIINSDNAQYGPVFTVQYRFITYEWAMNRRWVLWLSLVERCYYITISPLIGQGLPSWASDWLTRPADTLHRDLGWVWAMYSEGITVLGGEQRHQRQCSDDNTSHVTRRPCQELTKLIIIVCRDTIHFDLIIQHKPGKLLTLSPLIWGEWGGWGPLDNGQRTRSKLPLTRVMSLPILNSDSRDHTPAWAEQWAS